MTLEGFIPKQKKVPPPRADSPSLLKFSRPAALVAFLQALGCDQPSHDSTEDTRFTAESLGLPKGVCGDARHPDTTFFSNLVFTGAGAPYVGVNFSQLAAEKMKLQTAQDPAWEIAGMVPPHGINIEGSFNSSDVSGSANSVSIPGLHNDYAGWVLALDLVARQRDGHWVLELSDSTDPEFEGAGIARFHLLDGPMTLHGLGLEPSTDEQRDLEGRSEDTHWAMEGCKDWFEDGTLDGWLVGETGL